MGIPSFPSTQTAALSNAFANLCITPPSTTSICQFQRPRAVRTFKLLRLHVPPIIIPKGRKPFDCLKERLFVLIIWNSDPPFGLTSFMLFPQLPAEIRIRIWYFASHVQRDIKLLPSMTAPERLYFKFVRQPAPPAILYATRESRGEALRYYTRVAERCGITLHDSRCKLHRFQYVNFAVDRFVHVSSPPPDYRGGGYNFDHRTCLMIQKLALEYDNSISSTPTLIEISTRPLWDFIFVSDALKEFTLIRDYWFFPPYFTDSVTGDVMKRFFEREIARWARGVKVDRQAVGQDERDMFWLLHAHDPSNHWVNQRKKGPPLVVVEWRIRHFWWLGFPCWHAFA